MPDAGAFEKKIIIDFFSLFFVLFPLKWYISDPSKHMCNSRHGGEKSDDLQPILSHRSPSESEELELG